MTTNNDMEWVHKYLPKLCEVPEGWTHITTPWEGNREVDVLWADGDELPYHGTWKSYVWMAGKCHGWWGPCSDDTLPKAWKYYEKDGTQR
jgi:hypothetical protein